jgi:hypothetical protein
VLNEFKKSGEERLFKGGAQRDAAIGKGAPHWMPRIALFLVSRIYENGNIQRDKLSGGTGNGDTRNWESGMPIGELMGSAQRHLDEYQWGDRSAATSISSHLEPSKRSDDGDLGVSGPP